MRKRPNLYKRTPSLRTKLQSGVCQSSLAEVRFQSSHVSHPFCVTHEHQIKTYEAALSSMNQALLNSGNGALSMPTRWGFSIRHVSISLLTCQTESGLIASLAREQSSSICEQQGGPSGRHSTVLMQHTCDPMPVSLRASLESWCKQLNDTLFKALIKALLKHK